MEATGGAPSSPSFNFFLSTADLMEHVQVSLLGFSVAAAVLAAAFLAWRAAEWAWLTPRRLERELRKNGLRGNSYRPLFGDLKDEARMLKEAKKKPMPLLSHDIPPHVSPMLYSTVKENGKSCFLWAGPRPRVLVTDPGIIREILSTKFGDFEKPKLSKLITLVLTGIVVYEGDKWATHRRILNSAFHLEKLKLLLPAFKICAVDLIERWDAMIGTGESADVDIWPEFQSFAGDTISRCAFGSSYKEGRRIFEIQEEQTKILVGNFQYLILPGYHLLPTSVNLRIRSTEKEVSKILTGMIKRRMKATRDDGEHGAGEDLLGLLINSAAATSGRWKLTMQDLIEECKIFHMAGNQTTSVLLTWTMVVLAMHQEWQERAREEVLRVFGKNKPEYEGLTQLKILNMILYEVMRLYPPAILFQRITCKPTELGGVTYPPGVVMTIPVILVHHDQQLWGPDAGEFRPERFAHGVSNASRVAGAFLPFGAGPRICLGQNFTMIEARICLSMILQRFSFNLSPTYIHAPHFSMTLQPQHGAQIKLHRL